jgi:hypothetical protein
LFSTTAWTTGTLADFLGITASPDNPIGAFLPATQALDPGATGFFVYQPEREPPGKHQFGNPPSRFFHCRVL